MGGALFISVANNIFDNKLKQGLQNIGGINAEIITNIGATDLRSVVAPEKLDSVLIVYNAALVQAFYVAVGLSAAAIIGAVTVEWKNTNAGEKQRKLDSNSETHKAEKKGEEAV